VCRAASFFVGDDFAIAHRDVAMCARAEFAVMGDDNQRGAGVVQAFQQPSLADAVEVALAVRCERGCQEARATPLALAAESSAGR
jgi:hypothetical protein